MRLCKKIVVSARCGYCNQTTGNFGQKPNSVCLVERYFLIVSMPLLLRYGTHAWTIAWWLYNLEKNVHEFANRLVHLSVTRANQPSVVCIYIYIYTYIYICIGHGSSAPSNYKIVQQVITFDRKSRSMLSSHSCHVVLAALCNSAFNVMRFDLCRPFVYFYTWFLKFLMFKNTLSFLHF
jgi:hypothetical protein